MVSMNPTPRLRRLAAVAVLTMMAFGACGSDSDGESSADNTDTPTSSSSEGDEAAGGAAAEGDSVDIVDFAYAPPKLQVKVGTEVTFTNKDEAAHTVTAKDKSFDSKNMDKDAVFKQTFDKAGTYEYFCAIHTYMTAEVTVA